MSATRHTYALAVALSAACHTGPAQVGDPFYGAQAGDPFYAPFEDPVVVPLDAPRSREWFSVSVGVIERHGSDSSVVNDSVAWTLEGGYDILAKTVRIGPEIGVTWSSHDLDVAGSSSDDPDMSVTRWSFGGRIAFDLRSLGTVWYAHGGIYARDESSHDEPDVEQDSSGAYAGAGVEFWFDQIGRLGPFVRWYDSSETDLEEVIVGLSATFQF